MSSRLNPTELRRLADNPNPRLYPPIVPLTPEEVHQIADALEKAARLDEAERENAWVKDSLDRYGAPTRVRNPEGGETELNLAGRLECLVNPLNEAGWITPAQRIARLDEAERLLDQGENFWQHKHACPMLQRNLAWDIRNCTCSLVEFVAQLQHFRGR